VKKHSPAIQKNPKCRVLLNFARTGMHFLRRDLNIVSTGPSRDTSSDEKAHDETHTPGKSF
jgi:hypothetical protein